MFDTKPFKQAVLNQAMQGKLTQQLPEDGNASELLKSIDNDKQRLMNEGKIKKQNTLPDIDQDEVPFKIPDSWKWVRLAQLGYITSGGTPKRNIIEYWNSNDVPWLTPKYLGKNQKDIELKSSDQYISKLGLEKSSAQLIPKDSIVYSSRAPIGHINIVDFDFTTNQGAKSVSPILVNSVFLYYALKQQTNNIRKRASGTTFKEISGTKFGESLVPLPPLAEQQRIVSQIDKCFKLADSIDDEHELNRDFSANMHTSLLNAAMQGRLTKQLPEDGNASDLLNSIKDEKQRLIDEGKIKKQKALPDVDPDEIPFNIPDSWKWVRLGNVNLLENGDRGKNYPGKKYWLSKGVPFINAGSLSNNGVIDVNKLNYISKERFNLLRTGFVHPNDILYTLRGSVGKVGLNNIIKEGAIASSIIIVRPLIINSYFLLYFFLSPLNSKFVNDAINGSAQPNLSSRSLSNFLIPLPPLAEQQRIVKTLDSLFEKLNKI